MVREAALARRKLVFASELRAQRCGMATGFVEIWLDGVERSLAIDTELKAIPEADESKRRVALELPVR